MHERVLIFVDGSNLLRGIGQELKVKTNSLKPTDDELKLAIMIVDFLWSPRLDHESHVGADKGKVVRRYWFGSYQGNEEVGNTLKHTLRKADFEPILFNVPQSKGKEKRVDIAIAREMLINSFNRNMDIAVLVAGDEDYVDLVQDVKRYGVRITGSFFPKSGASPHFQRAVDYFHPLGIWGHGHIELTKAIIAANQAL
ncbi:MAG: NYN domain-containing protein [Candidatus Geothermincolia bacterium]